MPSYRYRAMDAGGKLVSGAIVANSEREGADRIDQLGLVLVDKVAVGDSKPASSFSLSGLFNKPKPEDVTVFTRDLALLLRAGARINDGLELMASDRDIGSLRPVIADIRSRVLSGESFAEALGRHPDLFPPMYIALIQVGEASGSLDSVLEVIANDRTRAEALARKVRDAMRYPMFILLAAGAVLTFFLVFVLPQFAAVLQDFGAKLDPIVAFFLGLSTFLRGNLDFILGALAVLLLVGWLSLRQPGVRASLKRILSSPPLVRELTSYHQTALFCRNLGVLLGSGVNLTSTLRILVDMMATAGSSGAWKGGARAPRRETVRCIIAGRSAAADGGADAAARRRDGTAANAGRPDRGILRGEAAALARSCCRHRGTGRDHRDKHCRRRSDRLDHDGADVCQPDRQLSFGSLSKK